MRIAMGLLAGVALVTGCGGSGSKKSDEAELKSSVHFDFIDDGISPADDFYAYANGNWIKNTKLPADKPSYGQFYVLRDKVNVQKKELIEEILQSSSRNDLEEKVAKLYQAYLDVDRIDAQGMAPLAPYLSQLEACNSIAELMHFAASMDRLGFGIGFYGSYLTEDPVDPTIFTLNMAQRGLGMPNRDYYLEDSERFANFRKEYRNHVDAMFASAGMSERPADVVLDLETALAKIQWSNKDRRDVNLTNNPIVRNKLEQLSPGLGWEEYFAGLKLPAKVSYVIVNEKSYFEKLGPLLVSHPIQDWKLLMRWQLVRSVASIMPKAIRDESFRFNSTVLLGIAAQKPRWELAMGFVEGAVGEGFGEVYVKRYFSEASKAKVLALVKNLLAAYKLSISSRDWLSAETKVKALEKLGKIDVKIGYPNKFKSYEGLELTGDSVLAYRVAASAFEHDEEIAKAGNKVDKTRWQMTPQTVNAYYNPSGNEIVFPAAILQAPFFDAKADDAVNYGGIGMVIGHEIGHAFDDQGAQFDGDGKLLNWWTKEDLEKFKALTSGLVAQYNKFEPVKGAFVDGGLTLGENIGDLGGASIALKAYRLAQQGDGKKPVKNALKGVRKFFISFAQIWAAVQTDEFVLQQVKTDPHSPAKYRVNGVLRNLDDFYKAFNVQESDGMYLPPSERVVVW